MSHDEHDAGSTSAAAARQLPPPPPPPPPPQPRPSPGDSDNVNEHDDAAATTDDNSPSRRRDKRRRQALAKKLELVSHLQKSLDMMVFAYICTLYSMECSFIRLLLRLLPHYSFLTPKDTILPPTILLPAEQPHVYTIFIPGLLCMAAHLFLALPQAGEASRGYLHGGVIIDFIGQKPPRSRAAFLALDLAILAAQCLMLAVHQERERIKKAVAPGLRTTLSLSAGGEQQSAEGTSGTTAADTMQDHDAEERGVRREDEAHLDLGGGIELQPLSASGRRRRRGGDNEDGQDDNSAGDRRNGDNDGDEEEDSTYASAAASADALDVMRSGNAVLANFHVVHAVRTAGRSTPGAAAYSLRTLGYGATLAAIAAERRERLIRAQQR
ncbi:hypothetical protein VTJ49DRAFT_3226 [Mycothermus thermophilus]|uniref:DUF1746 domain-containing protein n=1 Tax=Humicola insolens TaxID=85995 RepID=A0ABR3V8I9_HUMIN